jgi:hypothetical protein
MYRYVMKLKRKRLRIGYICSNHNMVYISGVNSNNATTAITLVACKSLHAGFYHSIMISCIIEKAVERVNDEWIGYEYREKEAPACGG